MLLLILNVPHDPFEMSAAETHNPVTGLPLEIRFADSRAMIDGVRRGALQFSNQFTGTDRRRYRNGNVDMCRRTSNFMHEEAFGVDEPLSQEPMD